MQKSHRFLKPLPEEIILLRFSFALQKTEVFNSLIRSFLISAVSVPFHFKHSIFLH